MIDRNLIVANVAMCLTYFAVSGYESKSIVDRTRRPECLSEIEIEDEILNYREQLNNLKRNEELAEASFESNLRFILSQSEKNIEIAVGIRGRRGAIDNHLADNLSLAQTQEQQTIVLLEEQKNQEGVIVGQTSSINTLNTDIASKQAQASAESNRTLALDQELLTVNNEMVSLTNQRAEILTNREALERKIDLHNHQIQHNEKRREFNNSRL